MTRLKYTTMLFALSFLFLGMAEADSVYKWTDEAGKVHYTSKKPSADAQPAKLPPIMRAEFKLKAKGTSCDKHGGINCGLGADKDGSVICADGFKDAAARFLFQCNTAKLEVSDVPGLDKDGAFKVFVRNSSSVAAKKAVVTVALNDGTKGTLSGPDEIEPFGMAEYTLENAPQASVPADPKPADVNVSCENCG